MVSHLLRTHNEKLGPEARIFGQTLLLDKLSSTRTFTSCGQLPYVQNLHRYLLWRNYKLVLLCWPKMQPQIPSDACVNLDLRVR